jgi:HEAT repeat protein
MVGRAALTLAVAAAWMGAARAALWPGAIEADGHALAASPEGERADAVARFVARYGAAAARPWLRPLMVDGPPQARLLVARVLVRAGDPRARQQALAWLTGPSSTPGDRTLGLDALSFDLDAGQGGAAPEVRAAFEQAARDPDAQTRAHALDALGRLDAAVPGRVSPSLPVILGGLDDLDREVRVRAVRLVARAVNVDRIATARAAPLLLERLDDADRLVRVTAIGALGELRDPRVVPALLRVAAADPPDLQLPAVDALGWPGATGAVPFLSTLLLRRPPDEAARHAARALGDIATPAAVAALVGALRLPPVADEIGRALVDAGPAAVGPLLRELDGPDLASAARAVALLGEIGDSQAVAPLARTVRHRAGTGPLALVAIAALEQLHRPQAFTALAEATQSPEAEVRRAALDALATMADGRAVALVEPGLADGDPTVRAAAARLAARLPQADPGATALAAGVDLLSDRVAEVRVAAAQALRVLPAPAAAARRDLLDRALAAASRPAGVRSDEEVQAIGAALEGLATPDDAPRLDAAFRSGVPTRLVAPALRAAHARDPIADRAIVRRLLDELTGEPAVALAAADALAVARLSDEDAAPLARAARDGEPALRARLCAAITRLSDGAGWLAAWMAPGQPPEVQAAAAWAARSHPELARVLRRLTETPEAPVAANARAALAWPKQRTSSVSIGARVIEADGTPAAGRWMTVSGAGGSVAVRTDGRGGVRVDGLPAGPVAIEVAR